MPFPHQVARFAFDVPELHVGQQFQRGAVAVLDAARSGGYSPHATRSAAQETDQAIGLAQREGFQNDGFRFAGRHEMSARSLGRRVRKVPEQAGRTCRTRLNTTGEEASQCWRGGVVEEKGEKVALGGIVGQFPKWENLQVLLSMSARRHFGGVGGCVASETESVAPPGLGTSSLDPVLTHWAKFCRASGAG